MAPMDVEDRDESDTVSEAGDLQQNDADDAEADVVPEEADVTLEGTCTMYMHTHKLSNQECNSVFPTYLLILQNVYVYQNI